MNLRSDPSTLAAQQPRPFAGTRPSEQSWSAQLWRSRAPAPNHPCDGDRGCSSISHRGGEHETLADAPCATSDPVPFTRRCSTHAVRTRKGPGSFPPPRRPPPGAPSSPRKRRRPRKGYAGRVVRKHGSSASPHGLHRPRSSRDGHNSDSLQKQPVRENEMTRPRSPSAQAGKQRGFLPAGNRRRRRTRTGATASRGGGFTARGRARASNMRCRDR